MRMITRTRLALRQVLHLGTALCVLCLPPGNLQAEGSTVQTDPAVFAAPDSPFALVQLPNGDRLHIDRTTGRATGIVSDALGAKTYATRMLTIDNAGMRGFARYDDTGRLFELARPVEGLESAEIPHGTMQVGADPTGRITHIMGSDGQALVFHRNAAGRLTSVTTHWGYLALGPHGLPQEAWIYPGIRVRPSTPGVHIFEAPVLPRPNPLQFLSLSNNDRFIRQAFALIDSNLRKLPPEQAIADWETYWTSGRYLVEDSYYTKTIAQLGPARPLEYWASGEPLKEYIALQATMFATLQAQFAFSYLQTVTLRTVGGTIGFQVGRILARDQYMSHVFSGVPGIADPDHLRQYFDQTDSFTDFVSSMWALSVVWRRAFRYSARLGDELPEPSRIVRRQKKRIEAPDQPNIQQITANDLTLESEAAELVDGQLYAVNRANSGLYVATGKPSTPTPKIVSGSNFLPDIEIDGIAYRPVDFTEGRSLYRSFTPSERLLAFLDKAYPDTKGIIRVEAAKYFTKRLISPPKAEAADGTAPTTDAQDAPNRISEAGFVTLTKRGENGRGGVRISPVFTPGEPGAAAGVRALLGECDFSANASCDLKP
ncbi:MAG: RHS repeat domain-containing protein [Ruegeria sp.]